jgi:hypothetical protein
MVLKSVLRFWTILLVGVCASNASDPLIVGYLLELLHLLPSESHADVVSLGNRDPVGVVPDIRVVFNRVMTGRCV